MSSDRLHDAVAAGVLGAEEPTDAAPIDRRDGAGDLQGEGGVDLPA